MDGPYAEAKEQRQQRPTALELLRRDRSRYQVMFGQEVPGGVVHFSQRFLIGDLCLDQALLRLRELVLGIEHEKNCLGTKLILTFFRSQVLGSKVPRGLGCGDDEFGLLEIVDRILDFRTNRLLQATHLVEAAPF